MKGRNLHLVVADALHLPFRERAFDLIIAIELIEHLKHPHRFVNICHNLLKSQGVLIISTPNLIIERTLVKIVNPLYLIKQRLFRKPVARGGPFMKHVSCLTYNEVKKLLESYFEIRFMAKQAKWVFLRPILPLIPNLLAPGWLIHAISK